MIFSSSYYPEHPHITKERIKDDANLMNKGGFTAVRMGEFAWYDFEPRDGEFNFSWMDEAVELFAEKGISTMMCTPTASPPKWLTDKHKNICMTFENGLKRAYGVRRHACINNEEYRLYSLRIIREMARHFKDNKNIIAYQLDNEFMAEGPYCYCETCRSKFISWLKEKYATTDELNKKWGLSFWSHCYSEWEEVEIPKSGEREASALLDFYRFSSESYAEFALLCAKAIREEGVKVPITHNICSSGFLYKMDMYKMFKELDVASVDSYPMNWRLEREYGAFPKDSYNYTETSLAMAITRACKDKHFYIAEQQAAIGVPPGYVRLWAYQTMAHGGELISYFPWRICPFGAEQWHEGVLWYDSVPRRTFYEIADTKKELDIILQAQKSMPLKSCAVIRDFNCDFAFQANCMPKNFMYLPHVHSYYDAIVRNHVNCDIISPEADFEDYKLIVAPSLIIIDEALKKKLEKFVENGGILITTFFSGMKNENNAYYTEIQPHMIKELTGIEIEEHVRKEHGAYLASHKKYPAGCIYDILSCNTAKTLYYLENTLIGKSTPAVTVNEFKNGKTYYVASQFDREFMTSFIADVLRENKIGKNVDSNEEELESIKVSDGENTYIYLINFAESSSYAEVSGEYINLLSNKKVEVKVAVEPLDVVVLKETD